MNSLLLESAYRSAKRSSSRSGSAMLRVVDPGLSGLRHECVQLECYVREESCREIRRRLLLLL